MASLLRHAQGPTHSPHADRNRDAVRVCPDALSAKGVVPGGEVYIYGWHRVGFAYTEVLFDGVAAEVVAVENQNGCELVVVRGRRSLVSTACPFLCRRPLPSRDCSGAVGPAYTNSRVKT